MKHSGISLSGMRVQFYSKTKARSNMGKMKVTTGNIARMVESTLETGNKLVTWL